jgi:hypothetical protein
MRGAARRPEFYRALAPGAVFIHNGAASLR